MWHCAWRKKITIGIGRDRMLLKSSVGFFQIELLNRKVQI